MERITVEDVENRPNPVGVHGTRRPVSRALGVEHAALVEYELDPGEQFSGGLRSCPHCRGWRCCSGAWRRKNV